MPNTGRELNSSIKRQPFAVYSAEGCFFVAVIFISTPYGLMYL